MGFGTAIALKRCTPLATVQVLEKEPPQAASKSIHNSGGLNAGLY